FDFVFNDGAIHSAQFSWMGNGEMGTVSLPDFGPCGALIPSATVSCTGGTVTNPNPFPIQVVYRVDGQVVFDDTVAANITQAINFTRDDGQIHQAEFTWSGNGQGATIDLGDFGPCGAVAAPGTANCNIGTILNPNPFPIQATFTVDGIVLFQGEIPPHITQFIPYDFNDGLVHTASYSWSGNGVGAVVDLGSFGPCGAAVPSGQADCDGGSITNPNLFPIQVDYQVDGVTQFSGQIPANTTQTIDYLFTDTAVHTAIFSWSGNDESGTVALGTFGPCGVLTPSGEAGCLGGLVVNPNPFPIQVTFEVDDRVVFVGIVPANTIQQIAYTYEDSVKHRAKFSWSGNGQAGEVDLGSFGPCASSSNQYQDFIGPVAFGDITPFLEPGKEYFDGTRSVMYNVEFVTDDNQGDVVFRFNGQELDGITTSIFNNGTFRQIESEQGRAQSTFEFGATKLIGYRFGKERTRIFQTFALTETTRWIHPLDQPFEHKPSFVLQLHGPPQQTDWLLYAAHQQRITYDVTGVATVTLAYTRPGLVAIYPISGSQFLPWTTVDAVTYPITETQSVSYDFAETGLYHYRVVDEVGQIIVDAQPRASLTFTATQNTTYFPQVVYPSTSLFVAVLDAMQFKPPTQWQMPLDPYREQVFEFHLDYHRLDDPDLGDDDIRGDIVVEALYLLNASPAVVQQFPYGRHDGTLPGVTIVGIPNVSLVAFCGRPGVHELVYWGGWENETYHRADVVRIFDQNLYDEWTADQRGDCIDAARRVNMLLAREGLRTDHTHRHHGEVSQGYQLSQRGAWSPYNLVGLRPPHLGHLLKPGRVIPFYSDEADLLFWGWDLENGDLNPELDRAALQTYIAKLGPIEYIDQTGLHPPQFHR
ncbi:MAG: hypothetical protein AAF629_19030, partial [Chloroflexota bacterium]